jgi:hypothetical protein
MMGLRVSGYRKMVVENRKTRRTAAEVHRVTPLRLRAHDLMTSRLYGHVEAMRNM